MSSRVPRPSAASRTPLELVLLASTAALLAAVAWPIATRPAQQAPEPQAATVTAPAMPVERPHPSSSSPASSPFVYIDPGLATPATEPTIQIALLLDTSSSMSGLIDQARGQLWRVVNALDGAALHGTRAHLEIALYEYGNSELPAEAGYIRQVSPFTAELDRVAEALFQLDTIGGSEHGGQVIARSLQELQWHEGALKVVYIAGNEELEQGPVPWRGAVEDARRRGVVVNTVHCASSGPPDEGWAEAAGLAGGRFLQIDHDAVVEHVAAPQDEEIARLGAALNATYVGYGREGRWGLDNQLAQDGNASGLGSSSSVQRAITKSSAQYRNPSWDLVDAVDGGTVTLGAVDRSELPTQLRDLSEAELHAWIEDKRKERASIQARLATLAKARAEHVAAVRAETAGPERLDTAIVGSMLQQARDAGFTLEPAA